MLNENKEIKQSREWLRQVYLLWESDALLLSGALTDIESIKICDLFENINEYLDNT